MSVAPENGRNRYVHCRVQDSRWGGSGNQRARWRNARAQVFPGADALRPIRAGHCVRNLCRPKAFSDGVYSFGDGDFGFALTFLPIPAEA